MRVPRKAVTPALCPRWWMAAVIGPAELLTHRGLQTVELKEHCSTLGLRDHGHPRLGDTAFPFRQYVWSGPSPARGSLLCQRPEQPARSCTCLLMCSFPQGVEHGGPSRQGASSVSPEKGLRKILHHVDGGNLPFPNYLLLNLPASYFFLQLGSRFLEFQFPYLSYENGNII